MAIASAGRFAIEFGFGSWPIMVKVIHDGKVVATVEATELPDLDYVLTRARIEARSIAQKHAPKEVQKL